jgi:hypothetical protein
VKLASEELKQQERWYVCRVQIVEDEHQRRAQRDVLEERSDGIEEI